MKHDILITNGQGTKQLASGTYTVSSEVNGYSNTTIDPSSLTIVDGTTSYNLTIAATGTLTIHVTDTGESTGTAITGATFYRCDSSGNTYGDIITTDATGNAVFNNVPYAATDAPTIYFKQIASDGEHTFEASLQNTTMTSETNTIEIANPNAQINTFTLTDENYENLPIEAGTISLTA